MLHCEKRYFHNSYNVHGPLYCLAGTPCDVCATSVNHLWHYVYIIAMFVSFFALPMLLLLCLYVKIILCLRTSGTALRARQVRPGVLFFSFLICEILPSSFIS